MTQIKTIKKEAGVKLKISNMTGKLEGFKALSTNTLTNSFCKKMHGSKNKNCICKYCFSFYMLEGYRKNCAIAWEKNSKALSNSILPIDCLPRVNDKYFRFSAHGELINNNHLINLVNICNKNPETNFTLYTKRVNIVNDVFNSIVKPENLIIIYSNTQINCIAKKPSKYFDKTFNVYTGNYQIINCNKKCIDCLICYKKNTSCVITEKIKNYTEA